MDTIQSDKARSPLETVQKQTPVDFQEEMRQSGISVIPLEVTEVKPGLHESAEGITTHTIYHISWPKQPIRLLGMLSLPHTDRGSGRFVKISPQRINMLPEAVERLRLAHHAAKVAESAIFLNTCLADYHLDVILAIWTSDQWLQLYRWNTSWSKLGLSRLEVCQF